jgi:hypothetical protein
MLLGLRVHQAEHEIGRAHRRLRFSPIEAISTTPWPSTEYDSGTSGTTTWWAQASAAVMRRPRRRGIDDDRWYCLASAFK